MFVRYMYKCMRTAVVVVAGVVWLPTAGRRSTRLEWFRKHVASRMSSAERSSQWARSPGNESFDCSQQQLSRVVERSDRRSSVLIDAADREGGVGAAAAVAVAFA